MQSLLIMNLPNLYIIILACLLTLTFREMTPYVIRWWKRVKPFKKRKSNIFDVLQYDILNKRIDELEIQLHNVAEKLAIRDKSRKANVRKEVLEYLKELKND
jgi:hypothetical protein